MKYSVTTFMSLLLLGVCSARSLGMSGSWDDDMKRKDDENYRDEDGQYEADDQKSEPFSQLKERVWQKLRNTYQQLTNYGNVSSSLDDLPDFADPIEVGTVDEKHYFGTIHHQQVQFTGLQGAHDAFLTIDTQSHEAILHISLNYAQIRGFYEASDSQLKKTSGSFSIKMSKKVTYICTYPYQVQGGQVQLQHSSGQLYYEGYDSHYENPGYFAEYLQNNLGQDLVQAVNKKVHHELRSKLHTRIQHLIQGMIQNQEYDSVEKAMLEGIHNAISGIQQVVWRQRGFSIDLTSDEKEMMYDKLHAKIASVKLNGIEKFYMAKNQVYNENSDKIRAKVELAIDRPTATAIVSLHEAHDEDAPFQKINVDFNMEKMVAELSLEKPARQSGLELRSVRTSVNYIRPVGTEKFEGRVSYLIKEKMASQMKRYIETGLKNFIEKQLNSIMSPGVLLPSQDQWSAPNRMQPKRTNWQ